MTTDHTNPAIRAAGLATHASAELLRFACEGDGMPHHPFGTHDPAVELAKAAIVAATIERDGMAALPNRAWAEEIAVLDDLIAACGKFVTAWSGELV